MNNITIIQAVLCGIVYWLAVGNLPFAGLWSLQRPLVCGAITGLILGHPVEGAVIGATINLVYLGFMSAGGSMPADMALAGVLGTTYAIAGGLDTKTALALAVPIGILGTIVAFAVETPDLKSLCAAWAPVLYAGILSSGAGYTLQIVGQKNMNPVVASLLLSLESVFSLIAGWVLLGQRLSVKEQFGCLLVFCAIILAQIPAPKKQK